MLSVLDGLTSWVEYPPLTCRNGNKKKAMAETMKCQWGTFAYGEVLPNGFNALSIQLGFCLRCISRVRPNRVLEAAYNAVLAALMQK